MDDVRKKLEQEVREKLGMKKNEEAQSSANAKNEKPKEKKASK